ncbi:MAG: hypothetical protein RMK18_09940 [Armatimonadota bacterium]|nr:hypothetical protein [Armatimonadota bacterium]MCX7778103.1 hypothetical protein [Armatimonadota bacterium]MDW8026164.1 hypothetical protein [Armatimonadota bacterium]
MKVRNIITVLVIHGGCLTLAMILSQLISGAADKPTNLVVNHSFEAVKRVSTARKPIPEGWQFYIIALPAEGYCDEGKAVTGKLSFKFSLSEKGKAFLHSRAFDVEPKAMYRIRLLSCGKGSISIEMLWWQSYPAPLTQSKQHRDTMKEAVKLSDSWRTLEITFKAPEDAKRAYLRIVATDGDVWVDDVEVKALP